VELRRHHSIETDNQEARTVTRFQGEKAFILKTAVETTKYTK